MNFQNFNKDAGKGVSSKYQVIQSGDLVAQLAAAGYKVTSFQEQSYRNKELRGYGKHAFRLRHESMLTKEEGHPEIVLRNSYNGTSCFQISLGFFRLVCANGLVVGKTFASRSVRHVGQTALDQVIDSMGLVLGQAEKMQDEISNLKAFQTTETQRNDFAKIIAGIIAPQNAALIHAKDLLTPQRAVDRATDLWTVLNVIQENSIRGGLRYTTSTQSERGVNVRNNTARAVRSIDRNFEINQTVWDVASNLAKTGILQAA
jgi:hypothetical protein